MSSPDRDKSKPKCIGLVRGETSGLRGPQHAVMLRRHAQQLGYRYLYTILPPQDHPDPVGYDCDRCSSRRADRLRPDRCRSHPLAGV